MITTGSGSSNLNMSTSVITSTPTSNMSTTPNASCVNFANYQGNNSEYTDYFGYTYDVRCNLDLQSAPTDHDAHADSFEDCLEYCSLLTDCAAVTYEDAPYTLNNLSNCHPKWDFGGYITSASGGVYSGVNVNGSSSGDIESQNLCTANNYQGASYNGLTYYDDYGIAWIIGCNNTLVITDSAALSTTVTDTLASCVDYCSIYDSCEMVNWTGPHANGTLDDPNCFPASAVGTADAAGSATGFGYAFVNNS
ncbi:hypothetical protein IMSHALPRED_004348 [Imshaugia aleurites]|uniref:Uncharacterized protein n=1 Tax=Imshaugia aleurites TaxID=172621 RepID=A0A8H3J880_9LECA|nr:hypothetical protein IMSHALPRED_004348 [Imshaugia aleurites]